MRPESFAGTRRTVQHLCDALVPPFAVPPHYEKTAKFGQTPHWPVPGSKAYLPVPAVCQLIQIWFRRLLWFLACHLIPCPAGTSNERRIHAAGGVRYK